MKGESVYVTLSYVCTIQARVSTIHPCVNLARGMREGGICGVDPCFFLVSCFREVIQEPHEILLLFIVSHTGALLPSCQCIGGLHATYLLGHAVPPSPPSSIIARAPCPVIALAPFPCHRPDTTLLPGSASSMPIFDISSAWSRVDQRWRLIW